MKLLILIIMMGLALAQYLPYNPQEYKENQDYHYRIAEAAPSSSVKVQRSAPQRRTANSKNAQRGRKVGTRAKNTKKTQKFSFKANQFDDLD